MHFADDLVSALTDTPIRPLITTSCPGLCCSSKTWADYFSWFTASDLKRHCPVGETANVRSSSVNFRGS